MTVTSSTQLLCLDCAAALICSSASCRHGGQCLQCGAIARLLAVAPCAHLFCLDCISTDRLACPSCRKPYTMQWVSDPARLENNPNPKWDVPMDVIEWQCSYTQKVCRSQSCVHVNRACLLGKLLHSCTCMQQTVGILSTGSSSWPSWQAVHCQKPRGQPVPLLLLLLHDCAFCRSQFMQYVNAAGAVSYTRPTSCTVPSSWP